ncbi:asparagine synthase-related protein [Shigella flexneri]
MKSLVPVRRTIKQFLVELFVERDGEIRSDYHRDWFDFDAVKDNVTDKNGCLRQALEDLLKSSDVPCALRRAALPGGLDSSIISAITKKYAARRVEDQATLEARRPQLHCCRSAGSPDRSPGSGTHLGTVHHVIYFTVQEGVYAIRDVIYHIEPTM